MSAAAAAPAPAPPAPRLLTQARWAVSDSLMISPLVRSRFALMRESNAPSRKHGESRNGIRAG